MQAIELVSQVCWTDILCTLAGMELGPQTPVPSLNILAHEAAAALTPSHAQVRAPDCADSVQKLCRLLGGAYFALPCAPLFVHLVCSPALASRQAVGCA